MLKISPERLMQDINDLSQIGRFKTGVHRPTLSPADMQARQWLRARMRDAGLDARIDGIGNVLGYGSTARRVLIGSHLESQPYAGRLDGAMGVLYGLEVARALQDAGRDIAVDVGAWADEEGYFGSYLGSRSFCGQVDEVEIACARHRDDGLPLTQALTQAGLTGLPREHIELGRYLAYCEAHIEQGAWLEDQKLSIGVVTAIVGSANFDITATGIQNHAGTTRMEVRKDAGLALCRLAVAIDDGFPAIAGPRSVWTTGRLDMTPGVHSVIPGKAVMAFQFRDTDPAVLARMQQCLDTLVQRANDKGPCRLDYTVTTVKPSPMAPHVMACMEEAAREIAGGMHARMPSAAGHDASVFSALMPSGMLFVPSIRGISHHYDEDTQDSDIILGCQVFAASVDKIIASAAQ